MSLVKYLDFGSSNCYEIAYSISIEGSHTYQSIYPTLSPVTSLQVDTIDPRPGITIHEGGRTTEGPKTFKTKGPSSPRANLRRVYPLDELPIHVLSSTPKHNIMRVPTELQS